MIKKTLFICALSVATTLVADTTNLLDFVPGDANVIVKMETRRFLNSPLVKKHFLDNPESTGLREIEAILAKQGLTLADAAEQVLVFVKTGETGEKPTGGMLLDTKLNEESLKTLLTDENGVAPSSRTFQGKSALVTMKGGPSQSLAADSPLPLPALEKSMAWIFLRPNVLMATSLDRVDPVLSSIKGDVGTPLRKRLLNEIDAIRDDAANPVVWAAFELKEKEATAQKTAQSDAPAQGGGGMMDAIMGGALAMYLKGEGDEDLALRLDLRCKDKYNAQLMAMQANGFVMLSCSTLGDDPQMGQDLIKAISIQAKEDALSMTLDLPKDLRLRLNEFLVQNKDLLNNAGPALTPGGGGRPASGKRSTGGKKSK